MEEGDLIGLDGGFLLPSDTAFYLVQQAALHIKVQVPPISHTVGSAG